MRAVFRRDRNADAGVRGDHVTDAAIGLPDRRIDLLHEMRRVRRTFHAGLNDGEFVAAEARGNIVFSEAAAQATRDRLQELIANRMPQGIIDTLEFVDVDVQNRQPFVGLNLLERPFELLAKQHPVRQIGERVVMRQMDDPLG